MVKKGSSVLANDKGTIQSKAKSCQAMMLIQCMPHASILASSQARVYCTVGTRTERFSVA